MAQTGKFLAGRLHSGSIYGLEWDMSSQNIGSKCFLPFSAYFHGVGFRLFLEPRSGELSCRSGDSLSAPACLHFSSPLLFRNPLRSQCLQWPLHISSYTGMPCTAHLKTVPVYSRLMRNSLRLGASAQWWKLKSQSPQQSLIISLPSIGTARCSLAFFFVCFILFFG